MESKKRKLAFILLMFLMLFVLPIGANAASKEKENVVKSINTFFRYTRKLDTKKMEKCFEDHNLRIFADPEAFYKILRPYHRKTQWKIRKVQINGKKAVVSMRVDFESLEESYFNYLTASLERALNGKKIKDPEKFLIQKMRSETAKNGSYPVYCNLKIRLKKAGGKWKLAMPSEKLINIIYCQMIYALDEFIEYVGE